jgi:hypothetical protein
VEILPRLGRGVALWRVAGRSYLVEHLISSVESAITDTDGRLRPAILEAEDALALGDRPSAQAMGATSA